LDFNGIIHNCSHPNDEDAHFRLSEEQIFTSIFAYVDHLFGKIKPKKLFFLAVDGVAPRAKMNQQRGRRFRSAREAKEVREKAEAKGENLPAEKAFDSNCITPGTPFMTRLSSQLKFPIGEMLKWFYLDTKFQEKANTRLWIIACSTQLQPRCSTLSLWFRCGFDHVGFVKS
jgi:5'-3' exoribonuclease 1